MPTENLTAFRQADGCCQRCGEPLLFCDDGAIYCPACDEARQNEADEGEPD